MDSTMVYKLIQQQLGKPKELINLLPTLASLITPKSRISTSHMNDQQIFSQVYNCINAVLQRKEDEKEQLISSLQNQQVEEEEQEQLEANEHEMQEQNYDEQQLVQQDGLEDQEAGIQGQDFDEQRDEVDEDGEDNEDDLGEQQAFEGEQDVGLYGEQIDQQEMESYENEGNSQQDKQFQEQQKLLKIKTKKFKKDQENQNDDLIDDQFDQFRQIQLQNKEEQVTKIQQKNDLQKQISKLEDKIIDKKGWVLKGEVKATQRPVNSLLQYDLQFKTGIRLTQQITPEYNEDLEIIIKQRILDQLFDDRTRYQHSQVLRQQFSNLKEVSREKSKQGLAQLYESQFKNFLGLGENKQDKLKTQIMQAFKQVNYYLDSLSNFHFTPRPTMASSKGEAAITEQKVPITMWKGKSAEQPTSKITSKYVSEKEQDKKGKRIKNKRIARQRKKEQDKKKLNKKIEYGGITKFQAKAAALKAKNNLNQTNIKYNKSANFFSEMNNDKTKKPNANISKMKI